MARKAIVLIMLMVGSAAMLSAGSAKFKCTGGGRIYRVRLATSSVFPVTLTWLKASSDNDILLFNPADGDLLGIGIGIAPRYEYVAIGGIINFQVDIVVIKASGGNSTCILRWSGELTNMSRADPVESLSDLGSLDELALTDAKYERMKVKVEEYLQLKRLAE